MNYQQLTGKTIKQGFEEFHRDNPHVFKAFEKQALKAIEMGKKKLSAKLIINWIRWNEELKTTDQNFKINDAFQSYYARAFITKYPEYYYVFELRKLRNEEQGQCMKVDKKGQYFFV